MDNISLFIKKLKKNTIYHINTINAIGCKNSIIECKNNAIECKNSIIVNINRLYRYTICSLVLYFLLIKFFL